MSPMLSFEMQHGTTEGKPGCTSAIVDYGIVYFAAIGLVMLFLESCIIEQREALYQFFVLGAVSVSNSG